MESIDARKNSLTEWLRDQCGLRFDELIAMAGDASFRRYFRVVTADGTFVAMDAPPPQENIAPFVAIARALKAKGVHTPDIIFTDFSCGFLLLEDFGDTTFLSALTAKNADHLYDLALETLAVLQACNHVPERDLPRFSADFMWQEWAWFKEWFLQKWLGFDVIQHEKELDSCYGKLVESAENQAHVFMQRDYHSANLMVLPNDQVGVLDFQDAFIGPVTYDLASLLRDCYIDWPAESVNRWALSYLRKLQKRDQLTDISDDAFLIAFDKMGMQRHLKALLTFSRKHVRDHQSNYLKHIPRTLNYLLTISANYPELTPLHDYLQNEVLTAIKRVEPLCVP